MTESTRAGETWDLAPEHGSWHQREVSRALQRLANASANVAVLEEQVELAAPLGPPIAPVEVRALERIHEQIERTRTQAAGPFGGHSLRVRLVELQTALHERLEQLGLSSYIDLVSLVAAHERRETDRMALLVARGEMLAAEARFIEVASIADPNPQIALEPVAVTPPAEKIDLDETYDDYDEAEYDYAVGEYPTTDEHVAAAAEYIRVAGDERYAEAGHDGRLPETDYDEAGYADSRYADSGYGDARYADARYADAPYVEGRYVGDVFVDGHYADAGQAGPAFGDSGYADAGYVDADPTDGAYAGDEGYDYAGGFQQTGGFDYDPRPEGLRPSHDERVIELDGFDNEPQRRSAAS